ncbi:MAG: PepSY domain-containing protein [Phycisphaerales bacterium]|nr:PepSY domain-containing protein [Phycisphaerales bacterium]
MSRNPVKKAMNIWSRRLHRWGAIASMVPVLVVIVTGILLQVKKQSTWVQPPTMRGSVTSPVIPMEAILEAARTVPEARIETWDDIDRLDLRPGRGVVKIQPVHTRYEVQVDLGTGEVLHVAYRRSDLIESIHDGSFFTEFAKLWIFLPSAIVLLALWITGMYLWVLPHWAKRTRRLASKAKSGGSANPAG